MVKRRDWMLRAVSAAAAQGIPGLATAQAGVATVPAAQFMRFPNMSQPVVSPSGRYVAFSFAGPDDELALGVVDLDKPGEIKGVARVNEGSVVGVRWVNDERLVFGLMDPQRGLGEQQPEGLLAVGRDGSNFRRLISSRAGREHGAAARDPVSWNHDLNRTLRDGSNDVILTRWNAEDEREVASAAGAYWRADLVRMNTETSQVRVIERDALPFAVHFLVDASGIPRLAESSREGQTTYHWREPGETNWREIQRSSAFELSADQFEPLMLGPDGQVYVTTGSGRPGGTSVLTTIDPRTGRLREKPVLAVDGFDFRGRLVFDSSSRKLIGVHYLSDAPGSHWLDEDVKAVQAKVDAQLPHTTNLMQVVRREASRWLVVAESDRQPPLYFAYDRVADKLHLIGASAPWIDAAQMAGRDFTRIKARDGLSIPVHVTTPRGKGPWPTVVLVHGGPYVDGAAWGWHAEAQFLASRGYLVVEPEFRGTRRYGHAHYRAGWKQWGLAMQDDITDATRWAVAQGWADPKRMAIAGASYGGYAAMMGLVKEPNLYRCGVNWVGVTDIALLDSVGYSDFGDQGRRFYLPTMVGDVKKDAAQLVATSPLQQAARIKAPVFMAYGGEDRRVPLVHGEKLRDALLRNGTPVEWVVYREEGHGMLKLSNRVDFYGRMEQFLAKHLS